MKRLLVLSRCSDPRGGADRIVADVCRALPSRGWQVELALARGNRFNRPELFREIHPDIPFRELDGSQGTRRSRLEAIGQTVREVQPDIVLTMRIFDAYEAVARIKSITGGPVPRLVTGIRAFEEHYLSDARAYREVIDGCITSGRLIARVCTEFSLIEPRRVFSIAGGVFQPLSVPARAGVRAPLRLLYAGRLEQTQKRASDLVALVRELTERNVSFTLDIAGDGPERDSLQRDLSPWTQQGNVRFLGWLPPAQLHEEVYPRADLFVHFAEWEGVTIAPREAMAHGVVPVISRFTGLYSEGLFRDGENALTFPVGDIRAAADAIVRIAKDPARYARLSAAAATSQTGAYCDEGAIDAWDRALRAICALPTRRGSYPEIDDAMPGRMTRLGIPATWQERIRSWTGRPVRHGSPGSEWPTSGGRMSAEEQQEIHSLAINLERQASTD